jgi:hypothetical protein
MSDKYDYEIITEKLNPPIGGIYRYAAKISFLVRLGEGSQRERVNPNLGEWYGTTEREAEEKIRQAVDDWSKDQS